MLIIISTKNGHVLDILKMGNITKHEYISEGPTEEFFPKLVKLPNLLN